MLFLARFRERQGARLAALVVDAVNAEHAAAMVEEETEGTRPDVLHEVPIGLFAAEVKFADPEDEEDEDNPANLVDGLVALVPFESFATWAGVTDDEDFPAELVEEIADEETEGDGGAVDDH